MRKIEIVKVLQIMNDTIKELTESQQNAEPTLRTILEIRKDTISKLRTQIMLEVNNEMDKESN